MMPGYIKSDFMEISLFGRMAYIFICLEEYLREQNEPEEKWKIVLDFLWSFSEQKSIDDYFYALTEHIPECVLEFEVYNSSWDYVSEEKFYALYELYQSCPFLKDVEFFLESAHEIIGYNMCGGVQPPEWCSLEMMEKEVLPFVREHLDYIPEISGFSVFSVSPEDCWNMNHTKEEINLKFVKANHAES